MRADLLVVDLDRPNTTPSYDPIASLVYSGNERNIHTVFVEGQLVMEDGSFKLVDERALMQSARDKTRALFKAAYAT